MELIFSYNKQGFFIDASRLQSFTIHGLDPFRFILEKGYLPSEGIMKDYVNEPNAPEIANFHLAFLHEIAHHYQDLSLSSCVCDRLFKISFQGDLIPQLYDGTCHFPLYLNAETKYWAYPKSIKDANILPYIYQLLFCIPSSINNWGQLHYDDLLEGHAELRSLFDFYTGEAKTPDNCRLIHRIVVEGEKYPFYLDKEHSSIAFKRFSSKWESKYHKVRLQFLRAFFETKSNFLNICQNFPALYSFYEKEIPVHPGSSLYGYMDYSYWVDFYLLLALDIALTIPSPSYIYERFKTKLQENTLSFEDFVGSFMGEFAPTLRFFKILEHFNKNAATFTTNLPIDKIEYAQLFDDISSALGWYNYETVCSSFFRDFNFARLDERDSVNDIQLQFLLRKRSETVAFCVKNDSLRSLWSYNVPIIIRGQEGLSCFTPNNEGRLSFRLYQLNENLCEAFQGYFSSEYEKLGYIALTNGIKQGLISRSDPRLQSFIKWKPYYACQDVVYYHFCNQLLSYLLIGNKHKRFICPFAEECRKRKEACEHLSDSNDFQIIINSPDNCLLTIGLQKIISKTTYGREE